MARTAVIIGAGPAGLTAAWELLERTDLQPVLLEATAALGGLSQTVLVRGNRMDIGGHRFFSKSDRVMDWWLARLPLQQLGDDAQITYQQRVRTVAAGSGPDPDKTDAVMLLRPRRSRIFHRGKLFSYPVRLDPDTVAKLGLRRTARIGLSYARAAAFPRPEDSLEDFLINRFGRELYNTFFSDYTEKVWGRPCSQISAEWGAQRIKGLDLRRALEHFLTRVLPGGERDAGLRQKQTETSLIERFLYPKLGPGQMWEQVAAEVTARGGQIRHGLRVSEVLRDPQDPGRVTGVSALDAEGRTVQFDADVVISTMPVRELVAGMSGVPSAVAEVAAGLVYRDFVTVGLLLDRLAGDADGRPLDDNWIYVQEPGITAGRIQLYGNWSPWLVADPATHWIGMEYFCNEGDALWSRSDDALSRLAVDELCAMGLASPDAVRDHHVVRMPRTYPAYFGSYDRFSELRTWLDDFENLWLVGRNGMHRYNNQDHSVLTAMVAVDQIAAGRCDKAPVWAVNTEAEYHESRD